MRLYWVRHGQMEGRAHTRLDLATIERVMSQELQGGLSDLGRRQAEVVARYFEAHPVDAVYASDIARARETGEVTARALGLPLEVRAAIRELVPGRLPPGSKRARLLSLLARAPVPSGVRRRALGAVLIPLYFQSWRRGETLEGETRDELEARLDAMLAELLAAHAADARIALFAHGYLILLLARRVGRREMVRASADRKPYIRNGSITELELHPDGRLELIRFADATHLDEPALRTSA